MVLKRKVANFDTQILRLSLYQLLCYFTASERIAKNDNFINLIDEFQDEQITITLITIATIVRTLDNKKGRYLAKLKNRTTCGFLIENGENTDLDLREACNKIIHSIESKFEILGKDNTRQIKPKISLYGEEQNKARWQAKIDIFDFVNAINGYIVPYC